jgi:hypothetical protein
MKDFLIFLSLSISLMDGKAVAAIVNLKFSYSEQFWKSLQVNSSKMCQNDVKTLIQSVASMELWALRSEILRILS